jgi:hypothetical protein
LRLVERSALVAERTGGVEADHVEAGGRVRALGRLPDPLELGPRAREPSGKGVREIVVAGHGEHGWPEGEEEGVGAFVLLPAPTIGEVARCHDQFGVDPLDQLGKRFLDFGVLVCPRVEVAHMQDVYAHSRMRL